LPHGAFALQSGKTTGCNLLPCYRSRIATTSAKVAMPFPEHKATIVLPDFARSLSADAFRIQQTYCKKKRAKACRKRGPGSLACGWKDFSGLIYSLLFVFNGVHEVATLSFWLLLIKHWPSAAKSGASNEREGPFRHTLFAWLQ
jgi:hypothetical protein